MADAFGLQAEEDPAAAFLAQQQHEIAGIEDDEGGFGFEQHALSQPSLFSSNSLSDEFGGATMNGELFQESNGESDGYAAIAQADVLRQEPESLRKWREEQKGRLEQLDTASKAAEAEWKEKAKKELEDWHAHQQEQMEKIKSTTERQRTPSLRSARTTAPAPSGRKWHGYATSIPRRAARPRTCLECAPSSFP
ncbi:hypothetical protein HF521_004934 [Silurus meridionalis]|uniref:Clathrin light chain n=1 Tax=Silurus meridionalis TaxID=175797 RepID=A0A8T0B0S1_SILME|nr:hypothetical protein HF521_004934 [Silurus meridionalis]